MTGRNSPNGAFDFVDENRRTCRAWPSRWDKKMQSVAAERLPPILSSKLRLTLGILLGIVLLLVISGAASIPFYFESSTILYKFGLNRHLLRLGQIMGGVAGSLLFLQIMLGARLKCLSLC